jgi:hypothetical protein
MIEELHLRAKDFFSKRFPSGLVLDVKKTVQDSETSAGLLDYWQYIGLNYCAGVKHRGVAVENLGQGDSVGLLQQVLKDSFVDTDQEVLSTVWNEQGTRWPVSNRDLPWAHTVLLYTSRLHQPAAVIVRAFGAVGLHVDVVVEEDLFKTVFVSYGGPDASVATDINHYLVSRGVRTWFFPKDARPGQKLHRVMHEGVNGYDKVLLLCSAASLSRPGVLNEIERALEREAREGGSDVLIPLALDHFVFGEWAPSRPDLAEQVRSRVITTLNATQIVVGQSHTELDRVVDALQISRR